MRKIILFNMTTLDGFFEGPHGEIDWHQVDEEFNLFAIEQLNAADGLIFGRITYEMMASYWPTLAAIKDDPIIAEKMNSIPKFVFSHSLANANWNNTRLIKGDAAEEIRKIKQQPGRDVLIFGSADLAAALTQDSLIDEYRLIINPIVLGGGNPFFKNVQQPVYFDLLSSRVFQNGNVLLVYQPAKKEHADE